MGETTKPTPKRTSKPRKTVAATTPAHQAAHDALDLKRVFPGDGEMAQLMRAFDWAQTPLGPIETWSPTLRTMVPFLLANRFPLLLWWGPDFLQLYNDAYRPVLGAKHPQYLGRSVRECWSEIWDVIGPLIETPFSGGPATWSEDLALEINRHGYTEETHFTVAYSPVPDETAPRGIGGVLATVHEITEQVIGERRIMALRDLGARSAEAKTAEEACQIAAETLARYPKDAPFTLLYLLDANGKRARLAATAGVEQDTLLCPTVIDLDAEDTEKALWPLMDVIQSERIQVVEDLSSYFTTISTSTWSDPPSSAVVTPIRSNVAHRLAGILIAGVSPRRVLDDRYVGFYELVASQIATALANAQAYEEERRRAEALAEIDRAKTAFFSNVSHEFRTPLTLMLGPVEDLLASNHQTPEAREQLDLIHRNGLRLLKLVNTLLDFSRIEAGRVQASYEPTDLATYTAELASSFRSLAGKAGLSLLVDSQPLGGLRAPVYVDREMWEKVVLNLLSNAFKYTFDGAITVTLHTVDGGDGVELTVRDTGVGIPDAELPRIFECFHRVEGTRARTHEGSGIGLALTQELVRLHGGTIRLESVEGEGTTVFVRLPAGAAHLPAERVQAPPALASTALGATPFVLEAERWLPNAENFDNIVDDMALRREGADPSRRGDTASSLSPAGSVRARIVLADDNADMREYLRRLLSERYSVEAVANGAEALSAIQRQEPDLVLTDVMMPELDGFGLLRALRGDPHTAALPVILLSARAGEEATLEGLAAGADDYLVKPFSAQEVLSRVAARLEIARLRNGGLANARELETFIEAVPDGIAVYDLAGRVVRSNTAYRDTLAHFTPKRPAATLRERVKQSPMRDTEGIPLPEDQWPHTRILRGEGIAGNDAIEVMMYTADGDAQYMSVSGAPLYTDDGRIIGAVAIHRDITAQKRLERELRQSRDELQSILEAVPDQVIVYDADLHLKRSNAAHRAAQQRFYGEQPPGELAERIERTQTVFRDLNGTPLPEGDWPQRRILRGEILSGSSAVETQAVTSEGKAQWWSVSGAPLRGENGTINGAVLVNSDITRRKGLEEALHRANERFQVAERAANGFVYEWDVRAGVIYRSEGAERLLGYQADEIPVSWEAWARMVYPGDWQASTDAEELAYLEALPGETLETEYRIRHRDGHYLTVADHAMIERDAAGHVIRLIGQTHDITERKRAEEEARSREEEFRTIANAAPALVWVCNNEGQAIYFNERWYDYTGQTEVEAAEAGWTRIMHPDDAKRILPYWERCQATGETYEGEVRYRDREGAYRWHTFRAVPRRRSDGRIEAWYGLSFDIEERKELEAELRASEERFRGIVETANEGVWLLDMEGRTVYVNERMAVMLGYRVAELIARPVGDFAFSEDVPLARERILSNLRGNTEQFDFRFRHRNGEPVLVLAGTSPVRDANGKIVGALAMLSDITERQRAEAEAAHLAAIVESADDAIVSKTLEGIVTTWNAGAERMFGYTAQEMIGQSIRRLIPLDRQREEDEILASIKAGERLQHYETVRVTKDGRTLDVALTISPIRDRKGAIIGASKIARDITERRQLEYAVAERASLLEAVFSAAPDRISIFDETGHIIRLNPAAQQIAGPGREQANMESVGWNFDLRTLDGEPFPREELPTARALRGEIVQGVEIIERDARQQDHYILTSSAPFYDLVGRLRGAVAIAHDVTAMRTAEREAAQWAAQLEATFESLTDGAFLYDSSGTLLRMNDAARAIFALDAAPDHYALTPEERRARLQVRDAQDHPLAPEEWGLSGLARGEQLIEPVELRITALDGTTKDLTITGSPVRTPDGTIIGAISLLRDVTDRRRIERAVAEQASQLQATFDALAEPMCVFDAEGRILRQNNAERTMFGFDTPPATIDKRARHIQLRSAEGLVLSPEESPGRRVLDGEILVGADTMETLARGGDGHDHWFSISGAPIRDNEENVIGGVIAYRDVTERRRLERDIEERASLLQTTFDAMTDGVLILNGDGTVRTCNDAYRLLMGYDPVTEEAGLSAEERRERFQARDIEGRPFPPESWPLRRILRGETITHENADDLYIHTRDGRKIIVNATGAPLHDADGLLIGALLVMRDVTGQRALQRERRLQANMLERAHDAIFMWEQNGPILYWNRGAEMLYGYSSEEAIGRLSHKLLKTERSVSPAVFRRALQRKGEWIGDIQHTTRDGRHVVVESRHQLLTEPGGRIYVLETCRDITERLKLLEDLRASEERQAFLLALGDKLRALSNPEEIKLASAESLGSYLGAARAGYGEVDEAGAYLDVEQDWTDGTVPSVAGRHALNQLGGETLEEARASWDITVEDFEADPRFADPSARAYFRQWGHRAVDSITLMKGGRFAAAMFVNSVSPRQWTREEHFLLREVAERTWAAVERARAEEALRRSRDELEQRVRERTRDLAGANRALRRLSSQVLEVQETERRRIARELHDEIGQALTGVKMMLETAQRKAAANKSPRSNGSNNVDPSYPLHDMRGAIDDALNRVRELSLDLRPAMLDSLGLLPTLLWRFENYMRQTGIQVEFHHSGLDQRFAPEVETGAYRITQEALTNVARHAATPVVRVQMMATDATLYVYIIDEGEGFDADGAIAAGLSTGLASMRERATLLGGAFLVSSTPGEGTTIEVELPLAPGEETESDRNAARDAERDKARDAQRDKEQDAEGGQDEEGER